MTKHTPGPWHIVDPEDHGEVQTPAGVLIARVALARVDKTDEEVESNLRLIAAAPDLLAALRYCETWFAKHSPTAELINNLGHSEYPMLTCIRAAIAKAEGR